jgi:hypothetical protein
MPTILVAHLKNHKNREMRYEDILHYQEIIVALTEMDRIM